MREARSFQVTKTRERRAARENGLKFVLAVEGSGLPSIEKKAAVDQNSVSSPNMKEEERVAKDAGKIIL